VLPADQADKFWTQWTFEALANRSK
jgi:hypothetical protein